MPNGDIAVIDRFTLRKSPRLDSEGHPYPIKPGAYPEDWNVLISDVMARTYPLDDGSGRRMGIFLTVCDSAGAKGVTARAYEFHHKLRTDYANTYFQRFRLVKGMPNVDAERAKIIYPDSQRKDRNAGARGEIPVLALNVNAIKTQLDGLLDRTEAGGGMIHFAAHLEKWFYAELCVETYDKKTRRWTNDRNLRNESTDLLTYTLGLRILPQLGGIERLDWEDETKLPEWAQDWDKNSLIVDNEGDDPFAQSDPEDPLEALRALGKRLG
jgi:phage terminase large subunit GpA-like protein